MPSIADVPWAATASAAAAPEDQERELSAYVASRGATHAQRRAGRRKAGSAAADGDRLMKDMFDKTVKQVYGGGSSDLYVDRAALTDTTKPQWFSLSVRLTGCSSLSHALRWRAGRASLQPNAMQDDDGCTLRLR